MTRNDVCSVRLKKEYDRTLDNPLKYREEVSYSTQKFPFEYEEDCAPLDTVDTFIFLLPRSIRIRRFAERYSPFCCRIYRRIITIRRAAGEQRKNIIPPNLGR